MFGDSYGELDSKKCPRQWTKNTPTEQAIRDNLLKNCLSRIKEKRKNVINNYRMNDTDSRRELVKNLIDEVYKASSPEAKGYQLNNNNSSSSYGVMDVFGSEDYYSLMDRIEDALSLELEAIDENDYYANQMEDYICSEESYSEVEENTLICPICRSFPMSISWSDNTLRCNCGSSFQLSNKQGELISIDEVKYLLADAYDRHLINRSAMVEDYNDCHLTFQLYNQKLYGCCVGCGYKESVL